jgi:magnesium transporter
VIRISVLRDKEIVQGGVELLDEWSEKSEQKFWIDICEAAREDIEPLLEEWFRFHELAAEDATSENTLPKYDSFATYDFFVFRAIKVQLAEHGIDTNKLACFLGGNFVFTVHAQTMEAVDAIWNRLPQDRRILQRGCDFLLYAVLDHMVDSHFPILDEIEEHIDEIHETVFAAPAPLLLDELLHLKRDLNVLRRQSLPQRELLNSISRGDAKFIASEHLIYFRDLYDHMFRIGESIDVERDLATSTMEAYLSVVANRTNDIMKVLTIFSSILLPVNLIAGIYGMNFLHMPELQWKWGYLWAIGVMFSIAVVMLIWFWRRGWILPSRRRFIREHRRAKRALRPLRSVRIMDASAGRQVSQSDPHAAGDDAPS